jgi:regulator of protease activity HflC (stomatin/prohibitin superfamily)
MSSSEDNRNTYMDQILEKQQKLEVDLRAKKRSAMPMQQLAQQAMMPAANGPARHGSGDTGRFARVAAPREEATSAAVEVRVTGWWRFKTVIVPPNAYVVHTRRGRAEPLHIGLGVSFKFDPAIDSFLVVPGAMQTILINAHCICKELQGLLVQGYVQWIVADFATAYKKLDFSDTEDPMRVVNLQLREQAEAAIKDKVATMGIDDVLSDKQPIIEELTARLRHVAEGEGGSDKGLGLRIVTVQIKEAVVSSSRLWENLQKPFRSARGQVARLAELAAETVIQEKEFEASRNTETEKLKYEDDVAALRSKNEIAAYSRDQAEKARRQKLEQEAARAKAQEEVQTALQLAELTKKRLAAEAEVAQQDLTGQNARAKLKVDGELAVLRARHDLQHHVAVAGTDLELTRARIENDVSPANLQARMIASLPTLAAALPKPNELKAVTIGPGGGEAQALTSLVGQLMSVVDTLRPHPKESAPRKG